jgi:hypothetical protein
MYIYIHVYNVYVHEYIALYYVYTVAACGGVWQPLVRGRLALLAACGGQCDRSHAPTTKVRLYAWRFEGLGAWISVLMTTLACKVVRRTRLMLGELSRYAPTPTCKGWHLRVNRSQLASPEWASTCVNVNPPRITLMI